MANELDVQKGSLPTPELLLEVRSAVLENDAQKTWKLVKGAHRDVQYRALNLAVQRDGIEIVKHLLTNGLLKVARERDGCHTMPVPWSALHTAIKWTRIDIVRLMLGMPADGEDMEDSLDTAAAWSDETRAILSLWTFDALLPRTNSILGFAALSLHNDSQLAPILRLLTKANKKLSLDHKHSRGNDSTLIARREDSLCWISHPVGSPATSCAWKWLEPWDHDEVHPHPRSAMAMLFFNPYLVDGYPLTTRTLCRSSLTPTTNTDASALGGPKSNSTSPRRGPKMGTGRRTKTGLPACLAWNFPCGTAPGPAPIATSSPAGESGSAPIWRHSSHTTEADPSLTTAAETKEAIELLDDAGDAYRQGFRFQKYRKEIHGSPIEPSDGRHRPIRLFE
ncbi:hypothetical protein B0H66DRAFT_538442 [Apodospora peruviana]|uniref:Ankyrin n=1 Tax=Apodospora peruviana TaxID=516989 RepID=A0AAE0HSM9_9PEZI|nr:hypothetical protein B0H66DRAFT_538442 [Apodospora peruviana]